MREGAGHLAAGDVTSLATRSAGRDLQHRGCALSEGYGTATAASRRPRRDAERMWPAIAATEQLAHRLLSSCWAIERIGGDAGRAAAGSMFGRTGLEALRQVLAQAALAVDGAGAPRPVAGVPDFIEAEVTDLYRSLRKEASE